MWCPGRGVLQRKCGGAEAWRMSPPCTRSCPETLSWRAGSGGDRRALAKNPVGTGRRPARDKVGGWESAQAHRAAAAQGEARIPERSLWAPFLEKTHLPQICYLDYLWLTLDRNELPEVLCFSRGVGSGGRGRARWRLWTQEASLRCVLEATSWER